MHISGHPSRDGTGSAPVADGGERASPPQPDERQNQERPIDGTIGVMPIGGTIGGIDGQVAWVTSQAPSPERYDGTVPARHELPPDDEGRGIAALERFGVAEPDDVT